MLRSHPGRTEREPHERKGIGPYSYDQIKNTKPVGRIGGILVGTFYGIWGMARLCEVVSTRRAEVRTFGATGSHVGAFVEVFGLFAISIFVGHVGVIYYWRKIADLVRGRKSVT
jgi:hypothetical protein